MANILRKTMTFLGFSEDDEEEFQFDMTENAPEEINQEEEFFDGEKSTKPGFFELRKQNRKVTPLHSVKNSNKSRVVISDPQEFEEVQSIGQDFKTSIPIIINLQNTNQELSKRIVDFCSGLAYALGGSIRKVADKVFLLTPENFMVTNEGKETFEDESLYNQL